MRGITIIAQISVVVLSILMPLSACVLTKQVTTSENYSASDIHTNDSLSAIQTKEDITELVECFLNEYSFKNSVPRKTVNDDVLNCFMQYRWPGNVRELRNTIMYIAAISKTNTITIETLPPIFTSSKDIDKINTPPSTLI